MKQIKIFLFFTLIVCINVTYGRESGKEKSLKPPAYAEPVTMPDMVSVKASLRQAPPAPHYVKTSAGNGQVEVFWNSSMGADSYNVKRSANSNGPFNVIATNIVATSFTDNGLSNGTTYYYVVSAVNSAGESPNSSTVKFVQGTTLNVLRNDYSGWVGLKFTIGSSPITVKSLGRYMISGNNSTHSLKLVQASNGVDVAGGSVSVNMAGGVANQFVYTPLDNPITLAANTTYYLVSLETQGGDQWYNEGSWVDITGVATGNGAVYYGNNTWSTTGTKDNTFGPLDFVYTGAAAAIPIAIPATPVNLKAVSQNTQVSLTWDGSVSATSYNIKRSVTKGGPYILIASNNLTKSYTDTGLSNGVTYYYIVSAVSPGGDSPNSKEVMGMPLSNSEPGPLWKYSYNTYDLWFSDQTSLIKGIFLFSYYGCGTDFSGYSEFRHMVSDLNCAIVCFPSMNNNVATSLDALNNLARVSGHPELAYAPIFVMGHSNGTPSAIGFAAAQSSRVFGWIAFKSASGDQFSQPGAYRIPGMVISGQNDSEYYTNQMATVKSLRQQYGALMHMIVEPGAGHWPNGTRTYSIVMTFMKTMFNLRVPANINTTYGPAMLIDQVESQGWLGSNDTMAPGHRQPGWTENWVNTTTYITSYGNYSGDKTVASWLPNQDYAIKWQQFVMDGIVVNW